MPSVLCWWEVDRDTRDLMTVARLRDCLAQARENAKGYRADRGAVPVPTLDDLTEYADLSIALDVRVSNGRDYLAANPTETRFRRIVRLLEIDADATRAWFLKLLERADRAFDMMMQMYSWCPMGKGFYDDTDDAIRDETIIEASREQMRWRYSLAFDVKQDEVIVDNEQFYVVTAEPKDFNELVFISVADVYTRESKTDANKIGADADAVAQLN